MEYIKRDIEDSLLDKIKSLPELIHVIIGPRQVGKTTAIKKVISAYKKTSKYITADGTQFKTASWLELEWGMALSEKVDLFVIDEIQKVESWSEAIKKIWDSRPSNSPKLVLLGSSSLEIHKGLSESLTGRFLNHRFYHWDFSESKKNKLDKIEDYLIYGGYPGSYALIKDPETWLKYIKESIVDTVINKDILSMTHVKSPALFRQCFDLACLHAAQEISYTKLLGKLQDRGNTDLVKHYLELFESAYLIKQLYKFNNKKLNIRRSSPKIIPLCPALYSSAIDLDFKEKNYGHAFEILICNKLMQLPGSLYYWREGSYEVDFIYTKGSSIYAIEVKYKNIKKTKGLEAFIKKYPDSKPLVINVDNYKDVIKTIAST